MNDILQCVSGLTLHEAISDEAAPIRAVQIHKNIQNAQLKDCV